MSHPPVPDRQAALPWLRDPWSHLQASRAAGRLAHGLLISGPRGVGKRHLAERLAHSLLCRAPRADDGVACGSCADCRLLAAGSHPDLIRVGPDPEAKSDEIRIGAIRQLLERESLTPSRAARKVVLIDPADRLNVAAANALLKTLEEPVSSTLLCLIGERAGQLPATVRSRCLQIRVPIPPEQEALDWLRDQSVSDDAQLRLRLARGGPLRALAELDAGLLEQRRQCLGGFLDLAHGRQDPLAVAALWCHLDPPLILEWLAGWICDLLRLMVAEAPARLDNLDRREDLAVLAARLDPGAGHRFLQRLLEGRSLVEANVSHQLLLESLAIEWSSLSSAHRPRENRRP